LDLVERRLSSFSCGARPCVEDVGHTVGISSKRCATLSDRGDEGLQQHLQAAFFRRLAEPAAPIARFDFLD
jgi:hypothetical protein